MQQAIPGQSNIIGADLISESTVQPITTGTVTGYLVATNGANAGKWWDAGGATWSDTKASAGAMSYRDGCRWTVIIAAAAWVNGVTYDFYAEESGGLNIEHTEQVVTWSPVALGAGPIEWTYTLTETGGSPPIADAEVWVTTDASGSNMIADAVTNAFGVATFYLPAGVYYVWRRKSGYVFTNPDVETVTE